MSTEGSPTSRARTWLLDLPFDVIRLKEAAALVRCAAVTRTPLMLATPNVNFAALAARDPGFRGAVLACDRFFADGMPIVWLSRFTGRPLPERVSGSSLFLELARQAGERPLRVFFFGGEDGVAEAAAGNVSRLGPGMVAAGWLSPGFGDLEQVSSKEIIEAINASSADLLLVAIGARRGHLWMARNRSRLSIPVIAYLGATINFVAGTVRRAPLLVQRVGLEWLWRVGAEPSLAPRYASDGINLLSRLARGLWQHLVGSRPGHRDELLFRELGTGSWMVAGALTGRTLDRWDAFLAQSAPTALTIDFAEVRCVDSGGLAALYEFLSRRTINGPRLVASSPPCHELVRFARILSSAGHPSISLD